MTYPDSTRPTEADVAELVRVAKRAIPILEAGRSNATAADLAAALELFRPDPEAELIAAMDEAYVRAMIGVSVESRREAGMRAALNVLKERDLLKTPTTRKATAL